MFCSKCGAKGNKENQFCQDCGNQLHAVKKDQGTTEQQENKKEPQTVCNEPEWVNTAKEAMNPTLQTANAEQEKQKINLKNPRLPIILAGLLVIIIALVLIVDLPSGSRGGRSSAVGEVGFDTPEEALIFYLEGLRDSNLEQMVSAFALESFVENFDLEAVIERVQSYNFFIEQRMTNANEFMTSLNLEHRRGRITGEIYNTYFRLAQVGFDIFVTERVEDAQAFVNELERDLVALDLESIEIIGFIPPELLSEIYLDEINQENIARNQDLFGADEVVSRVVVFQIGRDQFILMADVANYDGQWHLLTLGGNIGVIVGIHHGFGGLLVPEDIEFYLRDIDSLDDLIVPLD